MFWHRNWHLFIKKRKKMLTIQFPYMEIVWLEFFFKIFFVKKSFEQSIELLAKHFSVFWAATTENFDFFHFCFLKKKTLVIQFPYMEIVWLAFFWWRRRKFFEVFLKLPPKMFSVFFSTANWFSYSNKHFVKKKFCMQNLIFCVSWIYLCWTTSFNSLWKPQEFKKDHNVFSEWGVSLLRTLFLISTEGSEN